MEERSLAREMSAQRRALVDSPLCAQWGPSAKVAGMFLDDIDCFDRRLFSMSPLALAFTDPRQRLLLEAVWTAIEDAGLKKSELAGKKVGVFVAHDGWYLGSYVKRIPTEHLSNQEFIVPGNDPCFLANRISSVFDFHGPSMVFDTTCSGTYVALHHACQSLKNRECDYAIIGAVTLFLDPWKDGETMATPFESPSPDMRSFTKDATGYRTSEGCGAILLQRGTTAVDERHNVYGVICASGYNSGGKTNSFAQPSLAQQVGLFKEVLGSSKLSPDQIDYVEAHGVASIMGDATEANALIDVFQRQVSSTPCYVSTIKPNLGHNHASSGVYSLLKAVLSLRHDHIPPIRGLRGSVPNEEIPKDTKGVQFLTQAVDWPKKYCDNLARAPRYVFLTSYGFSNVNAAIVLKEHIPAAHASATPHRSGDHPGSQVMICLSAQSAAQLRQQLSQLRKFIDKSKESGEELSRFDLAYTLQVGREAMSHRWVAIVESIQALESALKAFLDGRHDGTTQSFAAKTEEKKSVLARLLENRTALGQKISEAFTAKDFTKLADFWLTGVELDWDRCYDQLPKRMHMPTYPFAKEHYWVPRKEVFESANTVATPRTLLHPLLHSNTSTASQQQFSSTFSGEEFFLADHVIGGQRILPGVAHLEMVRAALHRAANVADGARSVTLKNVVWARPLTVPHSAKEVHIRLFPQVDGDVHYEIYTEASNSEAGEVVHSEGVAVLQPLGEAPRLDLPALLAEMHAETISAEQLYTIPERLSLYIGARLRGVTQAHRGDRQVLAKIVLPDSVSDTHDQFFLHPSMADPVLQLAYLGLVMKLNEDIPLTIPFALQECKLYAACTPSMWVWIRYAPDSMPGDTVQKLDIDLCDDAGSVCMKMRNFCFRSREVEKTSAAKKRNTIAPPAQAARGDSVAPSALRVKAAEYFKRILSSTLHLPVHEIHTEQTFDKYGIDSLMVVRITNQLEKTFGSLPKTLFFEYRSVGELAAYFLQEHGDTLRAVLGVAAALAARSELPMQEVPHEPTDPERDLPIRVAPERVRNRDTGAWDIAIIGLSGRYPRAKNLQEYWKNLRDGIDCITEVPSERWNWREYYTADRSRPGCHYSRWGGFIDDVDKFDPLFFSIPPREAELMDPQERLFLQHVWMALEDAGYSRDTLASELRESTADPGENPAIGVYAGVMYGEYQLLGAESSIRGERVGFASTLGSIANRVSYVLDLHGPSITIDTQCSSSLTAIHLACQDLRLGNAGLAIAGGVNVTIHPNKYLELSRRQFISTKGHCESFGEGGDGYIPGEGVGVAVLKRLADAQRDGDHVYGVIKGSAINHGGKTNGYTVPSPNAQQAAIAGALRQARIDPRTVSYIEAHGTGTKLGDPIEIAGLTKAFYKNSDSSTGMKQYCWIGSVKSNIGHCESAAGIAGITKVLLQMKFSKIVPSLHSRTLNPNIDFSSTPFKVNQELRDWTRLEREDEQGNRVECPRIAGVSSFGAGGSNAHILIEEYVDAPQGNSSVSPTAPSDTSPGQVLIPLSARNPERLHDVARNLRDFLQQESHVELPSPGSPAQRNADKPLSLNIVDLAYTLQVGRDPMEERLGLIVGSVEELIEKLSAYLAGDNDIEGVYSAREGNDKDFLKAFAVDEDVESLIESWVAKKKYSRLVDLWVKGFAINWRALYREAKPQRLSLPTYPFAKERYWAPEAKAEFANGAGTLGADRLILHPLLHQNTSDFSEQRFSSAFTGEEFFLADHVVRGEKVLPGAAALEMARAAIARAARGWSENGAGLSLKHVIWSRPIVVSGGVKEVHIGLFPAERQNADSAGPEQIQFRIYSEPENESLEVVVHAQGVCETTKPGVESALDIEALRAGMHRGVVTAEQCYQRFELLGIRYGATHRGIQEIYLGDDQILARLSLPLALRGDGTPEASTASAFVLHPSLIDSALQATIGLDAVRTSDSPPLKPSVPFALDMIDVVGNCTAEMWAWARRSGSTRHSDPVQKFDIDVCDDQGRVRVRIRGLSTRALDDKMDVRMSSDFEGALLAAPFWKEEPVPTHTQPTSDMRRSILLCELSGIVVADIEAKIPDSTCLSLWSEKTSLAARFQDYATTIFERLKNAVRDQQQLTAPGNVQMQIVVPSTNEQRHLRALLGLVKTAALENPNISGQLIVAEAGETTEGLGEKLQENRYCTETSLIRYRQGKREVLSWRELEWYQAKPDLPWRDRGTYLITGGLGGLGVLFSREILRQAKNSTLILTGRSALDVEKQASLEALHAGGNRIEYRQVDVADAQDVDRLVQNLVGEYGSLQGIIHGAGIVRDNFIRKKAIEELESVFAPKVAGTLNLDEATKALNLDFFVLCSSIAGALGNAGQSDYCTANAFMDQYAHYRNELVSTGARHGRTLSLNWPLWEEGGMRVSDVVEIRMRQSLGMVPMKTAVGMSAFYAGLASQAGQIMVMQGNLPRLRSMLRGGHTPEPTKQRREAENPPAQSTVNRSRFEEATADYLKQVLSSSLKLPAGKIDANSPFEKYGIDSVLVMEMTNQLGGTFGAISNTLFYEYQTIAELAKYFVASHADKLRELLAVPEIAERAALPSAASVPPGRISSSTGDRFHRSSRDSREHASRPTNSPGALDIAIIGISGRYPQARHVGEYWENLRAGKDCITEVPLDRWDWREYYPEDKNQRRVHASKWGGFIAGVDEFDAAFFDIPGKEAEIMDPQERLFLEHVWASLEDAGYTRAALREKERDDCAGDVGVYVGVMYGEYQLYGAQDSVRGTPRGFAGSLASISNRVSYVLDLHGPSMTLDTMCSSSLTAIHLACQDLRQGHTALGIAGGVNLSLHPNKYVMLSAAKLISSEARCESFGIGGSGYVPGEGVGVVLLKRLADAQRDGDHIYGVIKGSAINHGGKTNGYCVPNPNAQRSAIDRALREATIDPRQISYIEAHGTGTKLGDPIEISALTKAFRKATTDTQFCWIGSAKSNIGHCESAAGVAALTKVLLQMRHGQLAPSLHSATLNPNIDFAQTPFIVNRELRDWQRPVVDGKQVSRIAGISAFGAGGSNAHLIVEEYYAAAEETSGHIATPGRSVLIPLSAKTPDRLRAAAANLLEYTNAAIGKPGAPAQRTQPAPDIADLSYTLQIGREAMDERLALIVGSLEDLQEKLRDFLAGKRDIHNLFRGRAKPARDEAPHPLTAYLGDEDIRTAVDSWISKKKYAKLLDLWVSGLEIDWSKLYDDVKPKRISLPTYPFAQVKYWWSGSPAGAVASDADTETQTALAPVEEVVPKNYFDCLPSSHLSTAERIEVFIATLLRSLLNVDGIDINADTALSSLSLESIHVVGFVDFWQATLGKAIPVTLFYETQTIGQLRDYIVTHGLATDADLDSASRILSADQGSRAGVKFQLSDMQESFVVGRNLPTLGQSVSSTIYLELVVDEALDLQRLQTAWRRIVRYHEVLHMKITADFQQEVMTQIPEHPIANRNLSASSGKGDSEQLLAVRKEMAYRTFDLEQWPYFEVRVSYLRTNCCVIHLAIDEVLVDGYSIQLITHQLQQLYSDPESDLPALQYSFRQYLDHLRAMESEEGYSQSMRYWKQKLQRLPPAPAIPSAVVVGANAKVHCLEGELEPRLWGKIKAKAQHLGCYPSTVLLRVFCNALWEHTRQDAFCINITNLNRLPLHRDVMRLAGLFINSSVYVYRHEENVPFEIQVLAHQRQLEVDSSHAHVGATRVLRELKSEGLTGADLPLSVVFTSLISSVFHGLDEKSGWQVSNVINTTPQVHVDHQVLEKDGALHYRWYVADALFQRKDIHSIFEQYGRKLRQTAESAESWSIAVVSGEDTGPFPLSNQQTAYAFGRSVQFQHGGRGCVFQAEYEVDCLNLAQLNQAWNAVVRHHPMLRTVIQSSGEQRTLDAFPEYSIEEAECATTEEDFAARCEEIREHMLANVYLLDSYPYFSIRVCRREGARSRVFINIDLMIADGKSLMRIIAQLWRRYLDPRYAFTPYRYSFREYLLFRQRQRHLPEVAAQRQYWQHKLAQIMPGPRQIQDSAATHAHTKQITCTFPYLRELREKSKRLGVGINSVMLAAYGETLLQWNRGLGFSIVAVKWDREPLHPDIDAVVGDFTRLSWVSFDATADGVDVKIRRVQEQIDRDETHRLVDGMEALRKVKGLSFPVVYTSVVEDPELLSTGLSGVTPVYAISHTPNVVLDNISSIVSDSAMKIQWDTILDAQGKETEMFHRYIETLKNWVNEATAEALTAARPDVLAVPAQGVCLHELFEQVATKFPQQCAVRFEGESVSYRELAEKTDQCAQWLLRQGIGPDDVVAVFMQRSVELVVALMGILRAGAAYLPIDVLAPGQRVQMILQDAKAKCVLTQTQFAHKWDEYPDMKILCLDDFPRPATHEPVERQLHAARENNLAYVIYTSGSTGVPKGCMIEHRSIVNRLSWMQAQFPLKVGDAVLQKTPYTFDVSVWEFFWPLIVGASVVVAKPGGHLDTDYLLDVIAKEKIGVCHFVPSMLRPMLQERDLHRMSGMQRVVVSGEALDYDLFEEFASHFSMPLENLYGPTEAAVDVSYWPCRKNPERRTYIGKAISGIRLYILDESMRPVELGKVGELYIAGVGVGRGYLNNPELTAKSFLLSPFDPNETLYKTGDLASAEKDGEILYHGRSDAQIKLHGLRIELEDIEQHIRPHRSIEDVVVAVRDFHGQQVLAAYVVTCDRSVGIDEDELRNFLRDRLPGYMIPHVWVEIEAIPLTEHGKQDRKRLPALNGNASRRSAEDKNAARSNVDARLYRILHDLLEGNVSSRDYETGPVQGHIH